MDIMIVCWYTLGLFEGPFIEKMIDRFREIKNVIAGNSMVFSKVGEGI